MISLYSALGAPDPHSRSFKREEYEDYRVEFYERPLPYGEESFSSILYGVSFYKGDSLEISAVISSLNLRLLSKALGESVETLKREYNAKGYMTEPNIVLFHKDEEIQYGRYRGLLDRDSATDFLFELIESYLEEEWIE